MPDLDLAIEQTKQAEGIDHKESAFLLWFLRNVLLVEELDAYEFAFEVPRPALGRAWDAAFLTRGDGPDNGTVLTVVDAKITSAHDPGQIVSAVKQAGSTSELLALLPQAGKSRDAGAITQVEIHLATMADAPSSVQRLDDHTELWTHGREKLEGVARALAAPVAVKCAIDVSAAESEILWSRSGDAVIAACPVRATEIVDWPGILDRTLFDLNVRVELGTGRVRKSLDRAISDVDSHANFLAFHNGITVVCDRVSASPEGLHIEDISVVNGAQSVLAFERNRGDLTDNLRVLVKFVETDTSSDLAREVAIRSNTQNPVDSRNLRALDPKQLELKDAFREYPGYVYVIRPDRAAPAASAVEIRNDDAAQLLCAVYNEQPWLAVKRLTLFETKHYRSIFSPRISAAHVILCHQVYAEIQDRKDGFPDTYKSAWKLTAIVATYLVGQILRADDELAHILEAPDEALRRNDLSDILAAATESVQGVLGDYHARLVQKGQTDDFKVDFKRETALRTLAREARQYGRRPSRRAAEH